MIILASFGKKMFNGSVLAIVLVAELERNTFCYPLSFDSVDISQILRFVFSFTFLLLPTKLHCELASIISNI